MASALGNKRARPLAAAAPPAVVANDGVLLPTELQCEVLLRLPTDVVCRLRLACRSWRSLTSEPHFTKAHAARHPLVAGLHEPSGEIRFMDLCGNVVKRISVRKNLSLHLSSQLDVPSTGEFKVLRVHVRNIGHQISCYLACDAITVGNGDDRGRWRVKQKAPFSPEWVNRDITAVNGVVYFLIDNDMDFIRSSGDSKAYISSFDLAAEEWRSAKIHCPPSMHLASTNKNNPYRDKVRLASLDGCLVTTLWDEEDYSMDLWFLVDVDRSIWTKRYSIQCASLSSWICPHPLVVLDDGRVIVKHKSTLKVYDTGTRTWELLTSIKDYHCTHKHQGNLLQSTSLEMGSA